jgi:hypothetical protein
VLDTKSPKHLEMAQRHISLSVVVEGEGWARHSGVLHKSREVFPAQQAEDVVGGGGDDDPRHNPKPSKTCPSDK